MQNLASTAYMALLDTRCDWAVRPWFSQHQVYLHYRINKHRDTSFENASILSTVDLSKHLIMA